MNDENDSWATALNNVLKSDSNQRIFRPEKLATVYANPIDEIFQRLIGASERLDNLGLEISAGAVLKVAQDLAMEPEIKKEVPAVPQLLDLETEVADVQ